MREVLSAIEERLGEPSAKALAGAISRAVRDGVLRPGDRLPPIRTVASQLALSPTTVSAAWQMLARAGIVRTDGRRGTTVADASIGGGQRYARAVAQEYALGRDLSKGVPDADLLPDIADVLLTVRTAGTPTSYLEAPVVPELEAALREDWPYDAAALGVVDGAMDAIDLFVRTHLRPGERVIVEDPGFPPLLDLLEAAGLDVIGAPMGPDGIELHTILPLPGPVSAVFVQPRAQNPTGVSMSAEACRRLAELLGSEPDLATALLVEDDSAGPASTAVQVSAGVWLPERTVHIRSFSKAYGPDLRLAAMTATDEVLGVINRARALGQGWSSRLLQRVLLALLTRPEPQEAVRLARVEYARRRATFVGALAGHGIPVGGSDGLNAWVPVADESAAMVHLAAQGIAVAAGSPFRVRRRRTGAHVRVTCGLVRDDIEDVAAHIAHAAQAGSWADRQR